MVQGTGYPLFCEWWLMFLTASVPQLSDPARATSPLFSGFTDSSSGTDSTGLQRILPFSTLGRA